MAYKDYPFFFGANAHTFENARALRNNATVAEKKLWQYLKGKKLGIKIRRQHPINQFIVDFYCNEINLIIEIDGNIHDLIEIKEYDREREKILQEMGNTIIRFTNEEIENNLNLVIEKIKHTIKSSLSNLERE